MAAGMAHEINQPLNVIQICADYFLKMLKKGESIPPADFKAMIMNIVENVDRASKVIRRVRDFARQTDVVRNEIDLNRPVEDSLKVVDHALKSHQIQLDLKLAENLPPILADHNRLEQVFINLVTNAIDAVESTDCGGRITLATRAFGDTVRFSVSDTGIGIPPEQVQRIFTPFHTTKEVGKGTGLGLPVSLGIVKGYGGEMYVDSEVGSGSTFTVVLPLASSGTVAAPAAATPGRTDP
jgi:signal transduction histidine kinase